MVVSDADDDVPVELEVKRRNAASAAPVDVAMLRNACLEAAGDVLSDNDAADTLVHPRLVTTSASAPTTVHNSATELRSSPLEMQVSDFADFM